MIQSVRRTSVANHRGRGGAIAFTLIELLIVVAIIAILAAIAVPNFLEAQVRAKVARVQSDMRTMATALETYHVDNNAYLPRFGGQSVNYATETSLGPPVPTQYGAAAGTRLKDSFGNPSLILLTTPVSYISTLMQDTFDKGIYRTTVDVPRIIDYYDPPATARFITRARQIANLSVDDAEPNGYVLTSVGPDGIFGFAISQWLDYPDEAGTGLNRTMHRFYDPTNGSVSAGNIYRFSAETNNERIFYP